MNQAVGFLQARGGTSSGLASGRLHTPRGVDTVAEHEEQFRETCRLQTREKGEARVLPPSVCFFSQAVNIAVASMGSGSSFYPSRMPPANRPTQSIGLGAPIALALTQKRPPENKSTKRPGAQLRPRCRENISYRQGKNEPCPTNRPSFIAPFVPSFGLLYAICIQQDLCTYQIIRLV